MLGKSFKQEVQKFDPTYQFATTIRIDKLKDITSNSLPFPLISIGSGGSLTSALFASLLHQQTTKMSIYSTPLEMLSLNGLMPNSAVLFVTAGGKNYDILNAFKFAASEEPRSLSVLCATKDSAIKNIVRDYYYANIFEFDLPCGKDGFLATNSLLCFILLLLRAYQDSYGNSYKIPETLESLVHPRLSRFDFLEELKSQFTPLLNRDTFLILFDRWGKPAAIDFESKFTEAALGNVQVVDYRNFAHGRHNWLAKRGNQTGIIALVTPEVERIANKTLDLIPKDIPIARLSTNNRPSQLAALDLVVKAMFVVDLIGESRNIDPGRPRVPSFGARIYNLRMPYRKVGKLHRLSAIETASVTRKLRSLSHLLSDDNIVEFWTEAFHRFVKELETARYGSIVLDYDGTLCEPANRYKGLSQETSQLLSRLVGKGITLGIATGRGRSVRLDLQKAITPSFWSRVYIGYYNGSDIGLLNDDNHPNKNVVVDPTLASLMDRIKNHERLMGIDKSECRPKQISFEPIDTFSVSGLVDLLRNEVDKQGLIGVQVLESSHSVDVLAPNVTKLSLVKEVETHLSEKGLTAESLCIGDKGKWPGNDFALLSGKYSLSADTVSSDPNSCWNLAPFGHRYVQATLDYLKALEFEKGLMRFNYNRICRETV